MFDRGPEWRLWAASAVALMLVTGLQAADAVSGRSTQILARLIEKPFPDPRCPAKVEPGNRCVWGKLSQALAELYLNRSRAELAAANASIQDACARIPTDAGYKGYRNPRNPAAGRVDRAYDFYFVSGLLLSRIYELFGHASHTWPGRITRQTEDAISGVLWDWAKSDCRMTDADSENTWAIRGSENHSAMHNTTCWSAAKIASVSLPGTLHYDDGSTPAAQYGAWTRYFKSYVRERAQKGMLVEMFSPGYYKYTLECFYNLCEFSDDVELRWLSRAFLDLWWADWAEEQIDGVHGGSAARFYQDATASESAGAGLAWLYFGDGDMRESFSPPLINAVTSTYRVPDVVNDVALDTEGRGVYEAVSRRPGLNLLPRQANAPVDPETKFPYDVLDPSYGGILRYSFCTPSFILGTSMVERRRDQPGNCRRSTAKPLISGPISPFAAHSSTRIGPAAWSRLPRARTSLCSISTLPGIDEGLRITLSVRNFRAQQSGQR